MKLLKYIPLVAAFLLASCFEDKGNYTYTPINDILFDTASFPVAYTVEVAAQLVIDPLIAFSSETVDPSRLAYAWYFYSDALLAKDWVQVSSERKLDMTMIHDPGKYKATLYVTDTTREITSHFTFDVSVISRISHGILLMHVNNGVTDFDYVATPVAVEAFDEVVHIRYVFQAINRRAPRGNPVNIYHVAKDAQQVNSVYISTDEEFARLNARNFLFEYDADALLVPPLPARPAFEFIDGQGGSSITQIFFINDGALRIISYGQQYYTDYSIPPPTDVDPALGAVRLAPACLRPTTSGSITANPIFYDAAGKRFLYVLNPAQPMAALRSLTAQADGQLFDVNNIGKDLLFLARGNNYYGYGVFSGGTGDYWLHEIDLPKAYTIATATPLARGLHDMSALPGIENAVGFDVGTRGHFLIYATPDNVYTCDYGGNDPAATALVAPVTATRLPCTIPPGETITAIKIYSYDNIYNQPYYANLNGTLLYVVTHDGAASHLREFAISPVDGTLVANDPLHVVDVNGRVVDIAIKIQYRESY